jgi:hypothetical protein
MRRKLKSNSLYQIHGAMGLFSSSAAPVQALEPFNPPLGVFPRYAVPRETTLVLKERAFTFSGDDFHIKDSNGVDVVICKGKSLSFRDQKGEAMDLRR